MDSRRTSSQIHERSGLPFSPEASRNMRDVILRAKSLEELVELTRTVPSAVTQTVIAQIEGRRDRHDV